tara:strand:- start:310 stop:1659 length:1350 start_codon:yes stop_codon:yes gene_type:complete
MARLNTYVQDTDVKSGDKLIGTEVDTGVTKNYTINSIGNFFNSNNSIAIGGQVIYSFVSNHNDFGNGKIMIDSYGGGDGSSLQSMTTLVISKNLIDTRSSEELVRKIFNSEVRIFGVTDINTYSDFTVVSIADDDYKENALSIVLSGFSGIGNLVNGNEYAITTLDTFNDPPTYSITKIIESHAGNTTSGADLIRVTCSDENGHTPVVLNITSYNTSYFNVNSTQDNVYIISAAQNIPVGTYTFTGTVSDSRNLSVNFSYTYVVTTQPVDVYIYGHTVGANDPNSTETLARERLGSLYGDAVVTSVVSGSILEQFVAGNIGQSTITVTAGTATLAKTGGLRDLKDLENLGAVNFSSGNKMLVILFPNSSELSNKPLAMYDFALPNANQQLNTYALYANASPPGTTATGLIGFNTSVAVDGYTEWIGILAETGSSGNYSYSYYADEETPS